MILKKTMNEFFPEDREILSGSYGILFVTVGFNCWDMNQILTDKLSLKSLHSNVFTMFCFGSYFVKVTILMHPGWKLRQVNAKWQQDR